MIVLLNYHILECKPGRTIFERFVADVHWTGYRQSLKFLVVHRSAEWLSRDLSTFVNCVFRDMLKTVSVFILLPVLHWAVAKYTISTTPMPQALFTPGSPAIRVTVIGKRLLTKFTSTWMAGEGSNRRNMWQWCCSQIEAAWWDIVFGETLKSANDLFSGRLTQKNGVNASE